MEKNKRKNLKGLVIAILCVTLMTIGFSIIIYNILKKETFSTLSEISSQNVLILQREIDRGKSSIENIALLLGDKNEFNIKETVDSLEKVSKDNNFLRIGIIDTNGIAHTTDNQMVNLKDTEYFKKSFYEKKVWFSETLINNSEGGRINVYSAPIIHDETVKGVIFGTYSSYNYEEIIDLDRFNLSGHAYIVKKNGDNITHSGDFKELEKLHNIFAILKHSSTSNEKTINKLKKDMGSNKKGVISFKNEISYYMYYQPLKISDWYLLTIVPKDIINSKANGTLLLMYIFTIVCVLVVISFFVYMKKIKEANQKELERLAFEDKVTGGITYEKFKILCRDIMDQHKNSKFAFIYLDIDKFKYINQMYGYDEGNYVLRYVSKTIYKDIREVGVFSRIEADDFALMIRYKNVKELIDVLNNILCNLKGYKKSQKKSYEIITSVGIYISKNNLEQIDYIMDKARIAHSKSKENKLGEYIFYDKKLKEELLQYKEFENRFSDAIKDLEFKVYYQPKYNLTKKSFEGAEALVRWIDSSGNIISPGAFVPVFEKNRFIIKLDKYVFNKVCKDIKQWIDKGYNICPISINISRFHLYNSSFVKEYINVIKYYNIPSNCVQLELTETVAFNNMEKINKVIKELKKEGIEVLLDDFGSGYSSVTMLTNIEVNTLKLDKCLIDGCDKKGNVRTLIDGLIYTAKTMDMKVVAEGVETKEQFEFLEEVNCDYIQGYYCAKPMNHSDYTEFLKNIM